MTTDNGIFVKPETEGTNTETNPEKPLKRFVKGLGFVLLVCGLAFAMVGGIFFGLRAIDFASKSHSYERSEISELDYSLIQNRTEKTYYVDGEENGLYFCEMKESGLTECLNSDHSVKLVYSSIRGNSFHRPELEILETGNVYRLACNKDKDGRYCVPVEHTV